MNRKFLLIYLVACAWSIQAIATEPILPNYKFDHKFIVNKGQISGMENAPSDIKYYVQRGLMTVYFLEDRVSYVLRSPNDQEVIKSRIDMSFSTANTPVIYGVGERKTKINYYTLDCPEGLNAEDYQKVVYENVYNSIDLVYYFDNQGSMKYDFIVHPGGDPSHIRVNYDGNIDMKVNEDGTMVVTSTAGNITEAAPYTYLGDDKDASVNSKFKVFEDNSLGFEIAEYNKNEILVIDPEVKWSTFYGGESFDDGIGSTTDSNGNLYLTGQTFSLEFPDVTLGYGTGESGDMVLGKFSPEGEHLWTIYYGGDEESKGRGIATDDMGNVFAVGFTDSKYLPNPQDPGTPLQASGNRDILVLKVNANGSPVEVRTFGSFNGNDEAEDIAYNNNGLYITGHTSTSEDEFPTTPTAHQPVKAADVDAFLMRLDNNMNVIWSTYLGGEKGDEAYGVTADSDGNVYITGATSSTTLPFTSNPFTPGASDENTDAFVAKFDQATGNLIWLQYLGGTGRDFGEDIVAFDNELIYVVGQTNSTDLEIVGNDTLQSHQQTFGGGVSDGFIFQLDATTGMIIWSSYLGGSNDDRALAVTTTGGAEAIVTGYTESQDFPTSNSDDAVRGSFQGGKEDAFISLFSDAGDLRYSGYVGGSNIDVGRAVSFDRGTESLYLVGRTRSADFPTTGDAYQPNYNGGADIFIYVLDAIIPPAEPIDTTIVGEVPTDTIPSKFCDNVRNNVISVNPLFDDIFSGACVDQIPGSSIIFLGTTPRILDGGNFNYLYQISTDQFETFENIRNADGELAMGKNLTLNDIDLSRYPPGVYYVRRIIITAACVDGSGQELLDYDDFTFALAGFNVSANCVGSTIQLTNTSNFSTGSAAVSYTYTVTIDGVVETFNEPNPEIGPYDAESIFVELEVVGDNGCIGYTSRTVSLSGDVQASFDAPNSGVGCTGVEQQFTNTSTSGSPIVSYAWDFGDGMTSTEENPLVTFTNVATDRTVSLTVTTENGCTSTTTQQIDIFAGPMADANAGSDEDEIVACGQSFQLNGSTNFGTISWSKFSGPGTATFANGSAGDATVTVSQNGIYEFVITANNNGCVDTDTVEVEFIGAVEAGFDYENDENVICLDYPYQFINTSTSAASNNPIVSYEWDFGGGMTSTEESPMITFTTPGAKVVTLTVTTALGCTDDFTMSFTNDQVLEAPTVNAGPDREITKGSIITLAPTVSYPSGQTGSVLWSSNPDGAFDTYATNVLGTRARPNVDSYLKLLVTSNRGCKAADSLFVEVNPTDEVGNPVIPDLFTPNNDGYNDFFEIPFLEDFPEARVKIFNRWGSLIYNTTNYYSNPWDGTYKGEPAPTGVYFYIISFPDGRNEIEGTVTLLR